MFPERFIKRIRCQKYIDPEALLEALKQPSPVSIRINPVKCHAVPLNAESVPWCKTGYYLNTRPSYTLDPLFHAGCYYPQEASGMFLEQILSQALIPSVKIKVLDLCGAPGGKSTHLSSMIGQNNLLVTNEVIMSRASVLKENISRWGVSNTLVTQNDPSAFSVLTGFFDLILVDAPCSGEGMFRNKVAKNEWSEGNAAHCSIRQKRILTNVWPALRENGILIYSTCTFNPDENEKNIRWLLDRYEAESVRLENKVINDISEIHYRGITGYGFYPGKIKGEGLFFSIIRKKVKSEKIPEVRAESYLKPDKSELKIVASWTDFPAENIVRVGDDVIAFPGNGSDVELLRQKLRIIKVGTKILTIKKKDYVPSHELALSSELKTNAFQVVDLNYKQALTYLKRGNPEVHYAPEGWFLVRYKGTSLGFLKNIGSRINNYYPVDWRIRMTLPENAVQEIVKWEE